MFLSESACRRAGGVASTAELQTAGATAADIAAAVAAGALARVRRGTYVLADAPSEIRHALSHGGPLCCGSAAVHHGLWVLEPERALHVWLGPDARAHGADRCRWLPHRAGGARPRAVVDVRTAVRQMLPCLGEEAFFCALESALRQGLLTATDLGWLRRRTPASARWLIDFARSDADSGLESLVRLRLHRLGIDVKTQVRVPGVGIVDFVIGDRLILEADGGTHCGDHRHRDLVRDAVATSLGFVTLRYDYALIVHDWPTVEAAVLSAVGRGLHLTSSVPHR